MNLQEYFTSAELLDGQHVDVSGTTFVVTFANKNEMEFPLDLKTLITFVHFLRDQQPACRAAWSAVQTHKPEYTVYEEKSYRAIYDLAKPVPGLATLASIGGSQTGYLTRVLAKLIAYLGKLNYEGIDQNTFFDLRSVEAAIESIPETFAGLRTLVMVGEAPVVEGISTEPAIKLAFQRWMRDTEGLADRTVSQYAGSAIETADRLHREQEPAFVGLYALRAPVAVSAILDRLNESTEWNTRNTTGGSMFSAGVKKYIEFLQAFRAAVPLPKPFLLLAGISGTGKTRFVREQAQYAGVGNENYLLVPVRPDWHEPSDLLGYVSRIAGERFVTTSLLAFMAKAWRAAGVKADTDGYLFNDPDTIDTYWVCLDEMNLAPVEQYFADYLAIVETREWIGGKYRCDPILRIDDLNLDGKALDRLRDELGFGAEDKLWLHFVEEGMPLPPNLVIAGTVNMDETAHGFSRKVIDRAFTVDFGEFFPNDFDRFFLPSVWPVALTFPRWSRVTRTDLASVAADADGSKSIEFLKGVNAKLENTSFRLAFRALNELLVSVRSFAPNNNEELAAVWDDFLMAKLLPRLEGDAEKMDYTGAGESLLTRLREHVEMTLSPLLNSTAPSPASKRPDLLRRADNPLEVELRTPRALRRMQVRLEKHNFTSFWP